MSHNKVTLNQNYFFDIESKVLTNLVGDVISLGENEKRVLSVFVSNENTVISKKQLIESVWNARGVQVDEASVTQAISSLRRSLSDSIKTPKFIKTEPRVGYKFIGEVEPVVNLEDQVIRQALSKRQETKEIKSNITGHENIYPRREDDIYDSTLLCYSMLVLIVVVLTSLIVFNYNDSQRVLLYLYNKIVS
ncbi:winged helix-turn-helix domain-containing protein [Vibrio fluvialis]|uniref:winged helix-turn-helix domain-containing protein n=1 Tax=Vibrio fluvialis TaxID=676 RepID=UPI00192B933F|nr:winged helix-turn-helix domain-containing protein [Vibrio fluvialis]MBL4239757.1 winged helix-turn-helix domain-containing protein [Vibrio fluvialis]MBL4264079.1 winged helix-turn-helix domain-containing protein [Vibrio fluvialis]MBL4269111.1 winged helix-turn-helix domain-containing protein [Vibrio fluvialis]MBL4273421.1 winged helix-turn-helix domain-containing protein [Vibrio fluvialis]MBO1438934.1 winged helix-turn-helix domain-containing protein [Vibrio fluvialis]